MEIGHEKIDPDAAKVVQRLTRHGFDAYLVGGCVRDLLLGRTPKDFDVATSATPTDAKQLFRNCRIIGRRFRLAHIFFGAKIIETSTFRANPRADEASDDGELLIRRDNVFGTAEEDARRRDFTINGLFYDLEHDQVIDYVGGMEDLAAHLVRTIGEPDIRFREDPVRILRAIKFAARLDFDVEPDTYRALLAHRAEIAKCSPARVGEEIYRLLRGGAAARSVELLVETGVLELLCPHLGTLIGPLDPPPGVAPDALDASRRLWSVLDALDERVRGRGLQPSNGLLVAALCAPFCGDALESDNRRGDDAGARIDEVLAPVTAGLHVSRRDAERARQTLLVQRRLDGLLRRGGRMPSVTRREYWLDALVLRLLRAEAEGATAAAIDRLEQVLAEVAPSADPGARPAPGAGGEIAAGDEEGAGAAEGEGLAPEARRRRRRRRGGRRRAPASTVTPRY